MEKDQVIAKVKAAIMASARHLSPHRMAAHMADSGCDWRGSPKGRMARRLAEKLCGVDVYRHPPDDKWNTPNGEAVEAVCFRFRSAEYRGCNGLRVEDADRLAKHIAEIRAQNESDAAKLAEIKAAGRVNYGIENPLQTRRFEQRRLERMLKALIDEEESTESITRLAP